MNAASDIIVAIWIKAAGAPDGAIREVALLPGTRAQMATGGGLPLARSAAPHGELVAVERCRRDRFRTPRACPGRGSQRRRLAVLGPTRQSYKPRTETGEDMMVDTSRKSGRRKAMLGIGGAIGSGAILAAMLYARRRETKETERPAHFPPDTD